MSLNIGYLKALVPGPFSIGCYLAALVLVGTLPGTKMAVRTGADPA